ncbi:CDP-alcohol phosphatidyltransferase family protein [Chitinophagales bacterium]|nr:CDP-alcohol phosphatidyltransferase family protein [Chitinophagales bacterium]
MSKLPKQYRFVDLSDYGRSIAHKIALALKNTSVTPVQVTCLFILSGLFAIICITNKFNFAAAFFLILKSILDAADGELARIKDSPSYIGRYFDSIADIILNFLFLFTFWYATDYSILYMLLAFIGIQLQGTLFNYYYVILRNSVDGDTTSRIFEDSAPTAMKGEKQETVDLFFRIFHLLYFAFDKTIYLMDKKAINSKPFPKWFMTLLSSFGLGFQLLIMSIMLVLNLEQYVIPFFIFYSILILVFIGIRRLILK